MAATSWTIRALLSSCDSIMRVGVNEKLERKERNIVELHEEKSTRPQLKNTLQ